MDNIESISKWKKLLKDSNTHPVLIYKHSSICPVSAKAFSILEEGINSGLIKSVLNIVIVQKNREVSNEIEKDIGLKHESPQLIIIKKEEVLYYANHQDINLDDIKDYLKEENE